MAQDFSEIVKLLGELPSMPAVVVKILELLQNDTTPTMLITETVAHEPAISARVVGMANSPYYGLRRKVSTLDHAINVIGRTTLKNIALETSLKSVNGSFGDLEKMLWENAVGCAIGTRLIAQESGGVDLDEAFMAGLFCNIGKMILAQRHGAEYMRVQLAVFKGEGDLATLEMKRFGFSHDTIGAAVLDRWHFSPVLVQAVLHQNDLRVDGDDPQARSLAAAVNVATTFCKKTGIGQVKPDETIDVTRLLSAFVLRIPPERLPELLEEFTQVYEEDREFYLAT